ncbi:MAG: peptidylprolyl isomerase [Gammaproteobacteria bacterium]|jgi:FKBP-type peptidyl-prolyl cis-trans isomerase SlpA|nr:peptidylprolyl isomerase [Gammaproteobacteria bacterium]MBT4494555.1 peptidylprolyl isomerase [Gammaproteobacteria bacterium]
MANDVPVGPGTRVTLKFELKLESGDHIDGTGDESAIFTVGDGSLLPGFEKALFGMKEGEKGSFQIEAEHGFGPLNPDNVHMLRRSDFSEDMKLEPGLVVSFNDPEGKCIPGVVGRVFDETVEIDFNHPLAGRVLHFDAVILNVTQVSAEIARM